MYCPRCGAQNTETTKYCRQCGLPMAQISGYVATGGTGGLTPPSGHSAPPPVQFTETAEMLALKQKRILTILSVCIAPVIFAILASEVFRVGDLAGIPFLLVPIGIAWATFRYKTQLRQLQERQLSNITRSNTINKCRSRRQGSYFNRNPISRNQVIHNQVSRN